MLARRSCSKVLWLVLALFLGLSLTCGGVEAVGGDASLVLAYFVTRDSTTVSVVDSAGLRASETVAVSSGELRRQVEALRALLGAPVEDTSEVTRRDRLLECAGELYALLIGPVEKALEGATELVLVPSGPLYYLPFGVLYRDEGGGSAESRAGQFLVERFAIRYATSLAAASAPAATREPRKGAALVLAAVLAEEDIAALCSQFLPCVIIDVSRVPEGGPSAALAGSRYRVLHVAAQALELEVASPLESAITPDPGMEALSSRIGDLLGCGLPADTLVVDAALAFARDPSARGAEGLPEEATGEEFRLMVEALQASVAPCLVLPLLNTPGAAGRNGLVGRFYEELGRGSTETQAFHQAQLALLRQDAGLSHVADWAGAALYGQGLPPEAPESAALDKLDASLREKYQDWVRQQHATGDRGEPVTVVVSMARPATPADLDVIRGIGDSVVVQGWYGVFVLVELPLADLEALVRVEGVRSVSAPFGTIYN